MSAAARRASGKGRRHPSDFQMHVFFSKKNRNERSGCAACTAGRQPPRGRARAAVPRLCRGRRFGDALVEKAVRGISNVYTSSKSKNRQKFKKMVPPRTHSASKDFPTSLEASALPS